MNYADAHPKLTYNKGIYPTDLYDTSYETCQQNFPKNNNYQEDYSEYMSRATQIEETQLSKEYFSRKNMKKIQELLKSYIYKKTHGKFRLDMDQDENDLLVAMRSVFMECAVFIPTNVEKQISVLNRKTIEYIAPDMITEIKQQYKYIKDISSPPKQLDRPMNVNGGQKKALPSYTSTWGF